uniref:DNA endonuclease activator Ctp1 C-terminal domain-containing protein n=1 Tax=Mycena chlorophos TaxID=658473 RepID=A0ABQ0L4K1_MYCCL|nr:predicted protein [Mycena chlorophos]
MPPTTYKGADLKARDKKIVDKHDKQLDEAHYKFRNLQTAYDKLSKGNWELVNSANNAAAKLGFRSFSEMCGLLSVSDDNVPYKEMARRVEELEESFDERVQTITEERDDALEQRDIVHAELMEAREHAEKSTAKFRALVDEVSQLKESISAMKEKHKRADEEFKDRYGRWKNFKAWMQSEETLFRQKAGELTPAERDAEKLHLCLKRRDRLAEMGLEGGVDEPDNEVVVTITPTRPVLSPSISPTLKPDAKSPSTLGARTPLTFVPVNSPSNSSPALKRSKPDDVIDLSESPHEDRPIVTPPSARIPPRPSSSQAKPHPMFAPPTPVVQKPKSPWPETGKKQRHSDVFVRPPNDEDDEDERPRKARRYSSPVRSVLQSNTRAVSRSPRKSPGRGRENRHRRSSNESPRKNAHASSSKQTGDYSAYKGRGRYAKAGGADETINGSYAIDPARNGGVNFQFAGVVRGKEDRRRLQGGDCEECRDYYEAIGPLPARLQPPLWRSPPTSPAKGASHACRHGHNSNSSSKKDREVAAHKQAISRHRQDWAQGTTPPGYWDIGFPSTQEAENINARAKEMQMHKMKQVREDDRYYRR